MPKTDEQGQATKTLLGKVFGMTGKRREMISLNGSGVEDPQGESLLERMAAGDKGDGEVRQKCFFFMSTVQAFEWLSGDTRQIPGYHVDRFEHCEGINLSRV